jgi:hypothetical protein
MNLAPDAREAIIGKVIQERLEPDVDVVRVGHGVG